MFLPSAKIEERSLYIDWLKPELNKQVHHVSLLFSLLNLYVFGLLFRVLSVLQCNWLV